MFAVAANPFFLELRAPCAALRHPSGRSSAGRCTEAHGWQRSERTDREAHEWSESGLAWVGQRRPPRATECSGVCCPEHRAAFLANAHGYEVELVADGSCPTDPQLTSIPFS